MKGCDFQTHLERFHQNHCIPADNIPIYSNYSLISSPESPVLSRHSSIKFTQITPGNEHLDSWWVNWYSYLKAPGGSGVQEECLQEAGFQSGAPHPALSIWEQAKWLGSFAEWHAFPKVGLTHSLDSRCLLTQCRAHHTSTTKRPVGKTASDKSRTAVIIFLMSIHGSGFMKQSNLGVFLSFSRKGKKENPKMNRKVQKY